MFKRKKLAIDGGKKIRSKPMPFRAVIGSKEKMMINKVFKYYESIKADPVFIKENLRVFTVKAFSIFMEVGIAMLVATGTAALYVSLAY